MKKNVLFVLSALFMLTGCDLIPCLNLSDIEFTVGGSEGTGTGGGSDNDPTDNPATDDFTNSQTWISQGYAASKEEALTKTANKQNCGLAFQQTTYLPAVNTGKTNNNDLFYYISDYNYNSDKTAYRINMIDGSQGPVIYKDCCYLGLEDIAAYLLAFGEVPPNMDYLKDDSSSAINDWGQLGRVNNEYYSNDTANYTYEPELTSYSSAASKYYAYYETDYGPYTCNPTQYGNYAVNSYYNNGSTIKRGVHRFCFTHNYSSQKTSNTNQTSITNASERHVFYTYNHYNDFQEYLNYYGGWNTIFGNMTQGNQYNNGPCTQTVPLFEKITLAEYETK